MTEQEYIDYFTSLATQHKAIRQTAQENRVYVVRDDNFTEVDMAARSMRLPALLIDQFYDDVLRANDNYRQRVVGGISVILKVEKGSTESIRQVREEARRIALSFLHRMYRDCTRPGSPLFGRRIVPSTEFEGQPTPLLAGGIATGWGYPFEWVMPTTVAVDPADWDDLTAPADRP